MTESEQIEALQQTVFELHEKLADALKAKEELRDKVKELLTK